MPIVVHLKRRKSMENEQSQLTRGLQCTRFDRINEKQMLKITRTEVKILKAVLEVIPGEFIPVWLWWAPPREHPILLEEEIMTTRRFIPEPLHVTS